MRARITSQVLQEDALLENYKKTRKINIKKADKGTKIVNKIKKEIATWRASRL